MSSFQDFSNKRFGKLLAIKRIGNNKYKQSLWLCKCNCGREVIIRAYCLKNGSTKSCGCYRKEFKCYNAKYNAKKYNRLYNIWKGINRRCYNKKDSSYNLYGGRGIIVCDDWKNDFEKFKDWAFENGYAEHLTIDRINNDGNYEPNNCRWATKKEQNSNTRRNIYITFNGETKVASDWAKQTGIGLYTILYRIRKNKPIEEIFYKGNLNKKMKEKYNGK